MARLPYTEGPQYPLNILKLLSHSSGTYDKWATLGGAHFTDLALPPKFRELVILLSTTKFHSSYEFTHHIPVSQKAGVTDAQRNEIAKSGVKKGYFSSGGGDDVGFEEKEKALLGFVEGIIESESGDVDDAVFDKIKELFSDREIVEIISLQVSTSELKQRSMPE